MIGRLIVAGIIGIVVLSAVAGLMDPSASKSTANAKADAEPGVTVTVETPGPEAAPPTQPPPAPTAAPVVANRANCDQIRGTDYNSPEERTWFLSNCVTH